MLTWPSSSTSRFLLACLTSLGLPAAAKAEQPADITTIPIEQLLNLEVTTASRIPQKLSEAPTSVSVITADDIRHFGYRTLAEVLESVRGVYVSNDRNYHYVGTRGAGRPGDFNTRLLILIDGQRLNDMVYDQGAAGTEFPIDVDVIERIEFVPGPGSALYGSSAFFGVINVITKTGGAHAGLALSAGAASSGGKQAGVRLGRREGDLDFLLAASWYNQAGDQLYFPEFDNPSSNNGIAEGLDYTRYQRLFAKVDYRGLRAQAWLSRRAKGIPTASYGQAFNDPRSRTDDQYMGVSLSCQSSFSDTLEVFGSLGVSRYRYLGKYAYDRDAATLNLDVANSQTTSAELRVLNTALRGHKIIAGAEAMWDGRRAMDNYDIHPVTRYLHVDRPKRRAAVYLQDEMRVGERLVLNTGLRHDYDQETGQRTSPRAALLFKLTPETTLKGVYGTAYRSPNAYERYYATSFTYKLNPALRPEEITTVELIAEYFPVERFRASASMFQYRFHDLIALATDPADQLLYYSNVEAARSRGVELEAEWRHEQGAMLKASASFQSARDEQTGAWLSNSPRRLFKLNYSTPLLGDRLHGGLEYHWTGRRLTTLGEQIGGGGVLNGTLIGYSPDKRLELSVSMRNMLDKDYAHTPSEEHFDNSIPVRRLRFIGQDGRSVRVTVTARF